jgi:dihydroneopterin triphosphate diphosphatase
MSSTPGRLPKIPGSVLVVIHTAALDVLLIERADFPGFWQSVTGSRDTVNEPLAVVAAREVEEETGIIAASLPPRALRDWRHHIDYPIYDVWRHRYAPGVTRNTEHWFSLQVPADTTVRLSPREHTASIWLPWQEAAARCTSPSNAQAIVELPERFRTG